MYLESQRTVHLLRSMQFGNYVSESNLHVPYALHKTGDRWDVQKRIKWMLMLLLQKR